MLGTECEWNRLAPPTMSSDDTVAVDIKQPYDYVNGFPFPPQDKQFYLFLLYLQLKCVTDYQQESPNYILKQNQELSYTVLKSC